MNLWLWEPTIAQTGIYELDDEKVDWLKPVVITPVPSIAGRQRSEKLWSVQAVDIY
jgi:hypothetical protein